MNKPKREPSPAERELEMLIELAPRLLAAGVTSVSVGGLSVTLAAPPNALPPPTAARDDAPAPPSSDPMNDPATYPGGKVPGFARPKELDR